MTTILDMATGRALSACSDVSAKSILDEQINAQQLALRLLSVAESEEKPPIPRPRPWLTVN
ncbi:hypothetical protein [Deefgea sp. CFH1-16]|uniref:hypothetical protein n=1 Tax=Deefgea sp. CFH1-16 TaxID=2675457 RepID=UPI0015F56367|nr:hypothetical protein [Deefgea sp. CFH1-16]MBM5575116.1 hypothetical protein [Deefgea sp. CFH1-16]